jgi:hypothetical protein
MTNEQKISILIRKYGSKSVIMDNDSSLLGTASSFSSNKVVPEQIWIDLKSVPNGKNPLLNSPVDLSTWPTGSSDPIIVKLIKKQLTWIPGTTAFYDPSDPNDISTVKDIISPDIDKSYSPLVYVLNTQSNRYLHNISPNEYDWVFDYETGCLVFVNGFPSFMKSPQFQPPAITCYRYLGRKSSSGNISVNLSQGATGPTGPTGLTGPTVSDSMLWRGQFSNLLGYKKNDTIYNEGIVWIKTTGPTGPNDFTSAYYDSLTYNELITGFMGTLNEQYVYKDFTSNESPYFENLNEVSDVLMNTTVVLGNNLKTNDQNINVFNVEGAQNFYSRTFYPYSNRIFFLSPQKMPSTINAYLEGAGYRMLSIEGLRSADATISTQSFLNLERSRLTANTQVEFLANSSVVSEGTSDICSIITDNLFEGSTVSLNGSSRINSCDFQGCTVKIGDPALTQPTNTNLYSGVVHYFQDTRFIDTTFELVYSGLYRNVTIVFNRCIISESRENIDDAGFIFPDGPQGFILGDPNLIRVNFVFIDSSIACQNSNFNFISGSNMTLMGINIFPQRIGPIVDIRAFPSGVVYPDTETNQFMQTQNSYSLISPRATTNFYFNQ